MEKNYFSQLNGINVNERTEKKNGLTYLSWVWAWGKVKENFPDATYTIYENADGWFYHTDGKTCWVKTGVTVNGIEHIEYLPVMDYKNKSIPADQVTSIDVNKAIQRSITKACARHGLGLYVYAGEDLPEQEKAPAADCADCGKGIVDTHNRNGELWTGEDVVGYSVRRFGRPLCPDCQKKALKVEKASARLNESPNALNSAVMEYRHDDAGDRL